MLYTIMIGTALFMTVPSLEVCELTRAHLIQTAIVEVSAEREFCIDGYALVTCVRTRGA